MDKRQKRKNVKRQVKKQRIWRCKLCKQILPTKKDLTFHIRLMHKKRTALRQIKLLEEGFVPKESKIGDKFRGKNKIIVS